jgi:MFS transporter, DHA3 family, macrolide efflux protein
MSSIWKDRRFFLYATGLMIDRFGNALYSVVLPLLVYSITHSALSMAMMSVSGFLPRALLSLFIGSLVDRISRRVVLFSALIFQGLCCSLMAGLYSFHHLSIWMLYLLGPAISIGFEFGRTAEIAVVPAMFKDRKMEANAGLGSVNSLMFILGPSLAGVMFGLFSYSTLLWFNAATYLGPILMCIWSRIPHETHLGGIKSVKQVGQDMKDGVTYLIRQKNLVHLLIIMLTVGIGISGITTVLLFHMKNNLHAKDSTISLIVAAYGIGLFLSSLVIPRFKNIPQGRFMMYSLLVMAGGLAVFQIPSLWLLPVAYLVTGAGNFAFQIARDTVMQSAVKNEMMGRIGSTLRTIFNLTVAVSTSILGAITATLGAEAAFGTSLLLLVASLVVLSRSPLIKFDQNHFDPEQEDGQATSRTVPQVLTQTTAIPQSNVKGVGQ